MYEYMGYYKHHHTGIAVKSIVEYFAREIGSSKMWDGKIYEDPIQKVRVAFFQDESKLYELVEPLNDKSPIKRLLEEKGEHVYHYCFVVQNLEVGIKRLKEVGWIIAKPPKPAVAFGGRRIAWMYLDSRNGNVTLYELLEEL
jgi:methylmalonyl-CoA/ethylmalonyl-CoA epimerase